MTLLDVDVVVLDIDDTLYLEIDYVRSGFRAVGDFVLEHYELDGFGVLCWGRFLAGQRSTIFNQVAKSCGIDLEVQELVEAYRSHTPDISLTTDSVNFLERIGDLPVAVITDGPAKSQRAKIQALGLDAVADLVMVTEEHGRDWQKPSSNAFLEVMAHFGRRGSRLAYIGDNPAKDFLAPIELGWQSIRVRRAGSLHEDSETPDAVHELMSLDQLETSESHGFCARNETNGSSNGPAVHTGGSLESGLVANE